MTLLTLWSLSTAALYVYVKKICMVNRGSSQNVALVLTRIVVVYSNWHQETRETLFSLPLLHPSYAFKRDGFILKISLRPDD